MSVLKLRPNSLDALINLRDVFEAKLSSTRLSILDLLLDILLQSLHLFQGLRAVRLELSLFTTESVHLGLEGCTAVVRAWGLTEGDTGAHSVLILASVLFSAA